jgi:hypothetical protein
MCNSSEIDVFFTKNSFYLVQYRLPVEYYLPLEIRHGALDDDQQKILDELFVVLSEVGGNNIQLLFSAECSKQSSILISLERISNGSYQGYQVSEPQKGPVEKWLLLLLSGLLDRQIIDLDSLLEGDTDFNSSEKEPNNFLLLRTKSYSAWDVEFCNGLVEGESVLSYCVTKDNSKNGSGKMTYFRSEPNKEPLTVKMGVMQPFNRRYLFNSTSELLYYTSVVGIIDQAPLSFVMRGCREDSIYLALKDLNTILFEGNNEVLRSFRHLHQDLIGESFSNDEIQRMRQSIACSQVRSFEETLLNQQ